MSDQTIETPDNVVAWVDAEGRTHHAAVGSRAHQQHVADQEQAAAAEAKATEADAPAEVAPASQAVAPKSTDAAKQEPASLTSTGRAKPAGPPAA